MLLSEPIACMLWAVLHRFFYYPFKSFLGSCLLLLADDLQVLDLGYMHGFSGNC